MQVTSQLNAKIQEQDKVIAEEEKLHQELRTSLAEQQFRQEEKDQLASKLRQMKRENASKNSILQKYKAEISEERRKARNLAQQLAENQACCSKLNESLKRLRRSCSTLTIERDYAQQQVGRYVEEIDASKATIQKLEAKLKAATEQVNAVRMENSRLQDNLGKQKEHLEMYRKYNGMSSMTQANNNLTNQESGMKLLAVYKQYFEEKSKKIDSITDVLKQLKLENRELKLLCHRLRQENNLLKTEIELISELNQLNIQQQQESSIDLSLQNPGNVSRPKNDKDSEEAQLGRLLAENGKLVAENKRLREKNNQAYFLVNRKLKQEIKNFMANLESIE